MSRLHTHLVNKAFAKTLLLISLFLLALSSPCANAQEEAGNKNSLFKGFKVSGDIQTDILIPENDVAIGAEIGDHRFRSNSYLGVKVQNRFLEGGIRGEYMKQPLPGFESKFAGAGIANIYLRGRYKTLDLTAGDFYDQFGSGLIFRTYEERSLGIDNSLRGGRLIYRPVDGVSIKALSGSQREYFQKRSGFVSGADLELTLADLIPFFEEKNWNTMLGAAFVSRNEADETILAESAHMDTIVRLNLPQNVGAYSLRMRTQVDKFSLDAEYAQKFNDPSYDNNYIYKNGTALLLSGSYSRPGMSFLVQAKRNENMSFRSARSRLGLSSFINHLPPFSMQHGYTLATHYPYATQQMGEWAFQTEARYLFKRRTKLGGRYGTNLRANFTYIRPLFNWDEHIAENQKGMTGYQPGFFEMGDDLLYQDFNVEVMKQVNRKLSFTTMYMNQHYNQLVVEKHAENGDIVKSNIFVLESKYKFSNKAIGRMELQYLTTKQDQGDWIYAVLEMNLFSTLMFSISDNYNAGVTKLHYPLVTATYTLGSHRFYAGYGRTREGINCAGGVCRMVPASRGLSVSYNYIF